jgi:hypothetical protein
MKTGPSTANTALQARLHRNAGSRRDFACAGKLSTSSSFFYSCDCFFNEQKACKNGRGAVLFSVARGKVSEGSLLPLLLLLLLIL